MKAMTVGLLILALAVALAPSAWCAEKPGWKAVGFRGGLPAADRSEYFHIYEAYANYGLPWSLRTRSGFGVALEVESSIGALHAAKHTGVVGAVGPNVVIDKGGRGLIFKIGADLYGTSRHWYETVNLNGILLFAGHVDVIYRFDAGPGIGYRWQHISNGGLQIGGDSDSNPGVDFHMIDLSWNFH